MKPIHKPLVILRFQQGHSNVGHSHHLVAMKPLIIVVTYARTHFLNHTRSSDAHQIMSPNDASIHASSVNSAVQGESLLNFVRPAQGVRVEVERFNAGVRFASGAVGDGDGGTEGRVLHRDSVHPPRAWWMRTSFNHSLGNSHNRIPLVTGNHKLCCLV